MGWAPKAVHGDSESVLVGWLWLWMIMDGYAWLVLVGYGWSWMVMDGYGWLCLLGWLVEWCSVLESVHTIHGKNFEDHVRMAVGSSCLTGSSGHTPGTKRITRWDRGVFDGSHQQRDEVTVRSQII